MKRLSLPIILALASSAIAHAQVSSINYNNSGKSITIATEGAYPPFNFTKTDGSLAGFDIDIGMAICEEIQANCTFIANNWEALIPNLNAKKYDAVIAGIPITGKREKIVDFSLPYYISTYNFVGRKSLEFKEGNPSYKIGTAPYYFSSTRYLSTIQPMYKNVTNFEAMDYALMALQKVKVDLVLSESFFVKDWLEDNTEFEKKGKTIYDTNEMYGITIRKESPLKQDFDKALVNLYLKGNYAIIYNKYF